MLFAGLGSVRMVKTCSFQIVILMAIANRIDRHTDGNFSLEFRAFSIFQFPIMHSVCPSGFA